MSYVRGLTMIAINANVDHFFLFRKKIPQYTLVHFITGKSTGFSMNIVSQELMSVKKHAIGMHKHLSAESDVNMLEQKREK